MNIARSFLCTFIAIVCFGCNNTNNHKIPTAQNPQQDSFATIESNAALLNKINTSDNIRVISYTQTWEWGKQDFVLCRYWHPPTQSELIAVIKKLKPTTIEADYEAHSDYSCNIEGKISINSEIYEYTLNAGGYLTLHNSTTKDVRLCAGNDTALKKYFLSIELDTVDFR